MLSLSKHLYRFVTHNLEPMKEAAFRELYKQFMFFSDNGTEAIEDPAIAMSEACKCSGLPREKVRQALRLFEEYGLIKRTDQERLRYTMTELGINQAHVEALVKQLTVA